MLKAYHVTTTKKLARYRTTGGILPPVRFWPNEYTAKRWAKKTGRDVILEFDMPTVRHPLPDHKPAYWTPKMVRQFNIVQGGQGV